MELAISRPNELIYDLTKKGAIQIDYVKIKTGKGDFDYIDGYIAEIQPFNTLAQLNASPYLEKTWPVRSKNGITTFDTFDQALKESIQLLAGLENNLDRKSLNVIISDYL